MLLPVADGKATGSIYFNLSSEVLTRTSSQSCCRWYLPTFLLRDRSLTLMYRASYCSYLVQVLPPNNFEIVDGNTVTTDVTVVIYGRGGFRCSLNLSPKVLEDSPIYSSSQSILSQ